MQQVQLDEDLFEGAVSFERDDDWIKPWRLPFPELRLFPPDDALVARGETAAGVRLRFRTTASQLGLSLVAADAAR
ncbi:MAG: GDSL family lipase, partial [Armatimonadota bacterium]